jgi:hypothetical protein
MHGQFVVTFAFVMTEIAFAACRFRFCIVVATENSCACMPSSPTAQSSMWHTLIRRKKPHCIRSLEDAAVSIPGPFAKPWRRGSVCECLWRCLGCSIRLPVHVHFFLAESGSDNQRVARKRSFIKRVSALRYSSPEQPAACTVAWAVSTCPVRAREELRCKSATVGHGSASNSGRTVGKGHCATLSFWWRANYWAPACRSHSFKRTRTLTINADKQPQTSSKRQRG